MRKIKSKFKWILAGFSAAILAVASVVAISGPSDAYIRSRIVRITSASGMCSGEQVRAPSGKDYILTAGHCDGLQAADGSYTIKTEDGKTLSRRAIAEDSNSDLLLLEGLPGIKGLEIANVSWQGERVKTFTHGRNWDTYTTYGQFIQTAMVDIPLHSDRDKCTDPKVKYWDEYGMCALHVLEEVSTALIAPGSSGGAIVDYHGDLVGVASASDGQAFYFFVTLSDIKGFLSNY